MAFERFKSLSRRTKTLIWVILLLLILLIGVLVYLRLRSQQESPTQPLSQETVTPQPNVLPPQIQDAGVIGEIQGLNGAEPTVADGLEQEVSLFAASFVERYGSYSNQSNFKNFADLDPFMTTTFKGFVQTYQSDLEAQYGDFNTYYGIETKVISTTIEKITDTSSTVLLKTQRQEFKNASTAPRVFYQDIRLELIHVGGEWKVQGAYWQ